MLYAARTSYVKHRWRNPLPHKLVPTEDPESFKVMPPRTTGLPLPPHPGAFGVARRHHTHEGVDLYASSGTPVYAVESGQIVEVMPFTGPAAGSPWWHNTQCVMVEGRSGVIVYGEIDPSVYRDRVVIAGDVVGYVREVLRKNKGRPTSMLHLELHHHGSRRCPDWTGERPEQLLDPTPFLLRAVQR